MSLNLERPLAGQPYVQIWDKCGVFVSRATSRVSQTCLVLDGQQKQRPLCVTIYSVIFACLICHPGKPLIGRSRILPINLIWSDSTSSMTQSCEGIFSGGGGPEMARFVELRSILPLVMLLGCSTLLFHIQEERPLHCTTCLFECVQVLESPR